MHEKIHLCCCDLSSPCFHISWNWLEWEHTRHPRSAPNNNHQWGKITRSLILTNCTHSLGIGFSCFFLRSGPILIAVCCWCCSFVRTSHFAFALGRKSYDERTARYWIVPNINSTWIGWIKWHHRLSRTYTTFKSYAVQNVRTKRWNSSAIFSISVFPALFLSVALQLWLRLQHIRLDLSLF